MVGAYQCVYNPPHQVIKGEPYSKRCDLYSYGVLLWELATYEIPFEGLNPLATMFSVANGGVCLLHCDCML